jgi:DNA-binding transcriptional LysR family regulator
MRAIDPVLLQSFVCVADAQSFAKAARRLSKSQPAISTHINRLENLLGLSLVVRGSGRREVSLTPAGAILLPFARGILGLQAEAWKRLNNVEIAGSVRLGVTEDHAALAVPKLIGLFRSLHPDVDVDIQTGMTLRMRHELGDRFDIVIAAQPLDSGGGEVLRQERLIWLSKNGRVHRHEGPLPLAVYPDGCLYRRWATDALDRINRSWRIAIASPSRSAILAAVAEGFAVTVLPASSIPSEVSDCVIHRGLPSLPKLEVALYRANDQRAATQALAEFLVERFATISRIS